MTNNNNRIVGLDILKCFASILVVFLHWTVSSVVGQVIHIMARVAVPLFFMITGYFIQSIFNKDAQWIYLRKIVLLAFYAYTLYVVFYFTLWDGEFSIPSSESLAIWVLTGDNHIGGHLWYLNALIVAVLVLVVVSKVTTLSRIYWTIPFLFGINYIISFLEVPSFYYRNFLFTGIPYILLGDWVKTHNDEFKCSPWRYFVMAFFFFLLLFVEIFCYHLEGLKVHREHFLMLIPICISLFIWALTLKPKQDNFFLNSLCYIGKNYSPYIYVYHCDILRFVGLSIIGFLQPIVAVIVSMLASSIHVIVKRLLCRK